MRRQRIELLDIADLPNLQLAVYKAAQGKRMRPEVAQFLAQLDQRVQRLSVDILNEYVPYGRYRAFVIHDPKQRLIHAACFEDRVLHHAIMNVAEPVFERALTPTTYACRPGMGVHRAVLQVQRNLQRYPWYVQVDIKGYFPAIDHLRLLQVLSRRFKGAEFMALLQRIIASYASKPGKGLPIGSLTSQHFANRYLDGADRFLLYHSKVQAQLRYMDDVVWWCADKTVTRQVLNDFARYVEQDCLLQLKPNPQLNRSDLGLTFCGFRVFPGIIKLTLRKQRRYRLLRQHYEQAWADGRLTARQLQTAYDAVLAVTLLTDCKVWRQQDLQWHPCLYDNDAG